MERKFERTEKTIIAISNLDEYTLYSCMDHGVFGQRNDITDGKCPFCKKECSKLENETELREKFRKELGLIAI